MFVFLIKNIRHKRLGGTLTNTPKIFKMSYFKALILGPLQLWFSLKLYLHSSVIRDYLSHMFQVPTVRNHQNILFSLHQPKIFYVLGTIPWPVRQLLDLFAPLEQCKGTYWKPEFTILFMLLNRRPDRKKIRKRQPSACIHFFDPCIHSLKEQHMLLQK